MPELRSVSIILAQIIAKLGSAAPYFLAQTVPPAVAGNSRRAEHQAGHNRYSQARPKLFGVHGCLLLSD
jgi:hypothetical protein